MNKSLFTPCRALMTDKHLKKLEDTYWGSLHGSQASLPMGGPPLSRDFTLLITSKTDYESSKF